MTVQTIGGKWKSVILFYLFERGTLRFGELCGFVENIAQRMLTLQQRELEATGLIRRKISPSYRRASSIPVRSSAARSSPSSAPCAYGENATSCAAKRISTSAKNCSRLRRKGDGEPRGRGYGAAKYSGVGFLWSILKTITLVFAVIIAGLVVLDGTLFANLFKKSE